VCSLGWAPPGEYAFFFYESAFVVVLNLVNRRRLPHPPQEEGARYAASWDNKKWFQIKSLLVISPFHTLRKREGQETRHHGIIRNGFKCNHSWSFRLLYSHVKSPLRYTILESTEVNLFCACDQP
jgi:hypothetical protein